MTLRQGTPTQRKSVAQRLISRTVLNSLKDRCVNEEVRQEGGTEGSEWKGAFGEGEREV
jgi:hypothetical protein